MMFDKLINIPGPVFLFLYSVYAFIVILIIKRYVAKDSSYNKEVPELTKLEPLDIAILRNGVKGAIITCLFNLWKKQAIAISTDKGALIISPKSLKKNSSLNQLEKTMYEYIKKAKYYKDLYKTSCIKAIEKVLEPNKSKLQELDLIPSDKIKNQYRKNIFYGIFLLAGLGSVKLYIGIMRDKPVGFLILLMIAAIIILCALIRPGKIKTTALGNKVLKNAEQRFEWLKTSQNNQDLLMDNNLLYGVAIFGISSFTGSELGEQLADLALLEDQSYTSSGGYNSGCGGCGGDQGSDSGGGDGCGGGCGGCGG